MEIKMKRFIWMPLCVLAIVLGTSCKKEELVVEEALPPSKPVVKQSEAAFLKNVISDLGLTLELGEQLSVKVDPATVNLNQSTLIVSLFPVAFNHPEEEVYVKKYLFPSVVMRFASDTQLDYAYLPEYLMDEKQGAEIWILKECADPNMVYEHVPTLLVKGANGYFKILDQNGDEMPIRLKS